jgi:hypothetical protein
MKQDIAQSKAKVKNWTKADWQKSGTAFNEICTALVALMKRRLPGESPEVQAVFKAKGYDPA